jgi:hypothetical protein
MIVGRKLLVDVTFFGLCTRGPAHHDAFPLGATRNRGTDADKKSENAVT